MGLIACRECGRKISDKAKNCPGCGVPVNYKKNGSGLLSGLAIGCSAIFGLFSIILCAGVIFTGSDAPEEHNFNPQIKNTKITQHSPQTPQTPQTDILEGVKYQIINDETFQDYKRSVDVRLEDKISEEQLKALALRLKAKNSNNFERTFITYLLPDMVLNSDAWATTHFNPELEVKILGLSVDEDRMLRQKPKVEHPGSIGSWFLEDLAFPVRITIYKKGGEYSMDTVYQDGNSSNDKLVEKDFEGGRKFMKFKRSGPKNDYYVITSKGNLQVWSVDIDDSHVLVAEGEKLD